MTPTFSSTVSVLITAGVSIGIMRFFKQNKEVVKSAENLFITIFLVIALVSLLRVLPIQLGERGWLQ